MPAVADPGLGVIDMHGLVVHHLRGDAAVAAVLGKRIYPRVYPDRVTLPAATVSFPSDVAVAPPTLGWFRYLGQVTGHADTHLDCLSIRREVQRALTELVGPHPAGVVVASDPFGGRSGDDGEWTPSKPYWRISLSVTARGS